MAAPSEAPQSDGRRRGLTLSTTIGIGVGMAVLVILIALAIWTLVRKQRSKWGKKRKGQGGIEPEGITPDEEIAKKIEDAKPKELEAGAAVGEGTIVKETRTADAAELGDGQNSRAELVGSGGDDKGDKKPATELYTGNNAHEMPAGPQSPMELGGARAIVAELDGTSVAIQKDESVQEPRSEKQASQEEKQGR